MNGSDKILVDTSAWIDFFRKKEPCFSLVGSLLGEQRICAAGIIVAELIQGAKSEKETDVLQEFIHVFEFLPETPQAWLKAGLLSFRLRRDGITVGLADCFLASLAHAQNVAMLSLDRHFPMMQQHVPVRLFPLPPA